MKQTLILCAVAVLTSLSAFAQTPVPRIGIISDAGARKEADLLLVELQKAKCELVERDEIKKIVGEQALQAMNRAECLRVGQMLKADGLILLSSGSNDVVSTRVVAVAPGVVVWLADVKRQALPRIVAANLEPYLPKLNVKKGDAVPVSLFRVRPELLTAQAIVVANELNRLLQIRLVRQSTVFVLERENLQQMEEEQRWAGQTTEFWTGSYMVEGLLRHDPVDREQLTLTLVVRRPSDGKQGTQPVHLVEKGAAKDLPALVNRIATKVCSHFLAATTAPSWDPANEGKLFAGLAGSLEDPRQRKIALETAMALGCRDLKTADAYRSALLEAVAGVRQHYVRLASAPHRAQQAADLFEYLHFQNSYRPPEGFTPETEKRWLYSYFVPLTAGADFLEGVAKAEAGDELREWIPKLQAVCQELLRRMLVFNKDLPNKAHANSYYHYVRYMYPKMTDLLALHRSGCASVPPREKVEPALPDRTTESAAQRDELWRNYVREFETGGTLEQRYLAWRMNLPPGDIGNLPEWRKHFEVILAHQEFWPMLVRDMLERNGLLADKLYYSQFPTYQLHEGAYYRRLDWQSHVRVSAEELAEVSRCARVWFLALMKSNLTKVDCWISPPAFMEFPYLELCSEAQAREIQAAIMERERALAHLPATEKTDLTFLRDRLAKLFPALADADYQARQAQLQAGNQQQQKTLAAARERALGIAHFIRLVGGDGDTGHRIGYRPLGWFHGKFWVRWQGEIIGYDSMTRKAVNSPYPLPWIPSHQRNHQFDESLCAVTASHLVYWDGPKLAVGTLACKDWRTTDLPFGIARVVEVAGKLYAAIELPAPNLRVLRGGVVSIDPSTLKMTTIREAGAKTIALDPRTNSVPMEALNFEGLGAVQDELVGWVKNTPFGWNPVTKTVRPLPNYDYLAVGANPHESASLAFGFKVQGSSQPNIVSLVVSSTTARVEQVIPLQLVGKIRSDLPPVLPWLATATSVLLPTHYPRGFYEIPYTDIQQWLAANPPEADKPAPGVSPTTSVVPAPKGSTR